MLIPVLVNALRTNRLWRVRGEGSLLRTYLSDYRRKGTGCSWLRIFVIHRRGFSVGDWKVLGLTKENYKHYLSTRDYHRIHPINGQYSQWIDDKLTLKYLFAGTNLDRYMPAYYYQINERGQLWCLMDCPAHKADPAWTDVADLLAAKGKLAVKTMGGSLGYGFYKAEYRDGQYTLNGECMDKEMFCSRLSKLRNYIIIEYLQPHKELAEFCPNTTNTIRYMLGRVDGRLKIMKPFIRFGTKSSGYVENFNSGGLLCYLDEQGMFREGYALQPDGHSGIIQRHPDSGKPLEGRIPLWEEIVSAGEKIDLAFPQLDYVGLDVVVTSKDEIKILEINSLTSLDAIQLDRSVYDYDWGRFFRDRLRKSEALI